MPPPVATILTLRRRARVRILTDTAVVLSALALLVALAYTIDRAVLDSVPSAAPAVTNGAAADSADGSPVIAGAMEASSGPEANDLQKRVAAIRRGLPGAVPGKVVGDETYVPLVALTSLAAGELRWPLGESAGAAVSDDGLIHFAADTSRIAVDGSETRLSAPIRMLTGEPWVPISAVRDIMGGEWRESEETGLITALAGGRSIAAVVPERLFSIEICRGKRWLKVFYAGKLAKEYPICSGKGNNTPVGHFHIRNKAVWPSWRAYWGENIPGGSRRNPLGARWLGTSARGHETGRAIGIHGTNQPSSIGRRISGGCIRTYNGNSIELYDTIPVGTRVWIHE